MHRPLIAKTIGLVSMAALASLAIPAFAQSSPVSPADRAFLMKVSEANIGEISAGMLAEQRANSATVRLLGKRYVDNHRTNQMQLTMLARRLNVMLPMHPSPQDQMTAAHLKLLHGPAFDSAFLSAEQKGHMKNINAFKQEIATSSSMPIVAYAKSSLPVLEEHLDLATDDANHMHMAGMSSMKGMSSSSGSTGTMSGSTGAMSGSGMQHSPGSPMNPAGQNANQSPVNNPNGSSSSINTQPATGAGQMSGSGTPSSPNDGSGTVPAAPAGTGR